MSFIKYICKSFLFMFALFYTNMHIVISSTEHQIYKLNSKFSVLGIWPAFSHLQIIDLHTHLTCH